MEMKFEVTIDIDDPEEATPDELEEAIRDALWWLSLPGGDTLCTTVPDVEYKAQEGE